MAQATAWLFGGYPPAGNKKKSGHNKHPLVSCSQTASFTPFFLVIPLFEEEGSVSSLYTAHSHLGAKLHEHFSPTRGGVSALLGGSRRSEGDQMQSRKGSGYVRLPANRHQKAV